MYVCLNVLRITYALLSCPCGTDCCCQVWDDLSKETDACKKAVDEEIKRYVRTYVRRYVELTYHTHTYYVRTGCAIVWTMRYINVRHTYVYLCVYVYVCMYFCMYGVTLCV